MKLENGHILPDPKQSTQPLQKHDNLDFMVHTELVQTFRNGAETNAAKGQITAQRLHIKPAVRSTENSSTNINMTSVCGAWEHIWLCLKEQASVQSNLQRSWEKTSWLVSSVEFWAEISRQVVHAREMFLLPMAAWLHATYHGSTHKKKGSPSLTHCPNTRRFLQHLHTSSCAALLAEVPEMPGNWGKILQHFSAFS